MRVHSPRSTWRLASIIGLGLYREKRRGKQVLPRFLNNPVRESMRQGRSSIQNWCYFSFTTLGHLHNFKPSGSPGAYNRYMYILKQRGYKKKTLRGGRHPWIMRMAFKQAKCVERGQKQTKVAKTGPCCAMQSGPGSQTKTKAGRFGVPRLGCGQAFWVDAGPGVLQNAGRPLRTGF